MKLSFAICTHNEGTYIQALLNQLIPFCEESGDEIVVVDDYSTDELTLSLLNAYSDQGSILLFKRHLDGSFADHKNFLTEKCSGDYIVQIDADELLHDNLLTYLHDLVENNPDIDLLYVPRVNVVTGLTAEDIARYGWTVNERGWVMFPDYQSRIYRNDINIRWEGKVHERIQGAIHTAPLPPEEEWAIYHIKDRQRQVEQNNFYASL